MVTGVETSYAVHELAVRANPVPCLERASEHIFQQVELWVDKTNLSLPDHLFARCRRMLARPHVQRALREEGYNPAALGKPRASSAQSAAT